MKIIIAGPRKGVTENQFHVGVTALFEYSNLPLIEIVSGMAQGVDTFAVNLARDCNIKLKEFPANWEAFGMTAGFMRNAEMAEYADVLYAIWNEESTGTLDMIKQMKRLKKKYYVYSTKQGKVIEAWNTSHSLADLLCL